METYICKRLGIHSQPSPTAAFAWESFLLKTFYDIALIHIPLLFRA